MRAILSEATPAARDRTRRIWCVHSAAEALNVLRDLSETPTVSTLALAFQAANHELALVGGPVRDAFLGRGINDLDFTTSARPDQILTLVEPVAEAVWDIGRDFGTIGAQIQGERVEITTYRSDAYDGASRKPAVQFGDSLVDDVERVLSDALDAFHTLDAHATRIFRAAQRIARAA